MFLCALETVEPVCTCRNGDHLSAGAVLNPDWTASLFQTGCPALEECNEQRVSDTPCLSVIAGLSSAAKPHTS